MEVNLSELRTKVENQQLVIEGITADYATMKSQIAELQAAVDADNSDEIQAQIDSLVALVNTSNAKLIALDESVPPQPPV